MNIFQPRIDLFLPPGPQQPLDQIRVHVSRTQRVAADSPGTPFCFDGLSEHDDGAFAGSVSGFFLGADADAHAHAAD